MTEWQGSWPGATPPTPPPVPMQPPSGLFPGHPTRPVYREPHPVAAGGVMAGLGATVLWFVLFGTIGRDLLTYAWWTVVAAITAWIVAAVLALLGDRGVAVGVAIASSLGLSIAAGFVTHRWIATDDWPLW
jgi:hypothetical protein